MSESSLPAAEQPRSAVTQVPEHLQRGTHGRQIRIRCENRYGALLNFCTVAYRHLVEQQSTVHLTVYSGGADIGLRYLKPDDARLLAAALIDSADEADQQTAEFAAAMQAAGGAA